MKYPLAETYTLKQKFNGQMAALSNMGLEVWYLSFDHEYIYLNHGDEREKINKTIMGKNRHYIHTLAFIDLYRSVLKVLQKKSFDYVYFRKSPIGIIGYRMCRKIGKMDTKLIVEIPTYPEEGEKAKNVLRSIYSKYSRMWWKKCYPKVKLFTLIGKASDNYKGYPAINIENGVYVDNIPLREPKEDGRIHLLALASMCVWHGYDRIIQSLADYQGEDKEDIIIDMVGNEGDGSLEKWKSLAESQGVGSQVIFHGRKEGEDLNTIFNQSTLGICSLGLYRNGFEKGSILKLREYTARGLPFVYAAEDPCVNTEMGYCYKVSNNDEPIGMAGIVEFAKKVAGNTDLGNSMRNYAKNNISWEGQYKKIFSYFEND